MCSEGWNYKESNGECPDCGEETTDGIATVGCDHSPKLCKTCESAPCDESC